jgi:hypothetical protein
MDQGHGLGLRGSSHRASRSKCPEAVGRPRPSRPADGSLRCPWRQLPAHFSRRLPRLRPNGASTWAMPGYSAEEAAGVRPPQGSSLNSGGAGQPHVPRPRPGSLRLMQQAAGSGQDHPPAGDEQQGSSRRISRLRSSQATPWTRGMDMDLSDGAASRRRQGGAGLRMAAPATQTKPSRLQAHCHGHGRGGNREQAQTAGTGLRATGRVGAALPTHTRSR